VIREGETFVDGSLTTLHGGVAGTGSRVIQSNEATGERYRWIGESGGGSEGRYGSRMVSLYGRGEAVAVRYGSSTASR
jgi:hypothetical protein